jgi:hypothetical protein
LAFLLVFPFNQLHQESVSAFLAGIGKLIAPVWRGHESLGMFALANPML